MHFLFRYTAIFIMLLLLASCSPTSNQSSKGKTEIIPPANTTATTVTERILSRNKISEDMLGQIIAHYRSQFKSDSFTVTNIRTDTLLELLVTNAHVAPEDFGATLFAAHISLVNNINPLILGDVDGDLKEDILFSVQTEGGGGGGNIWWSDHFLFLQTEKEQYTLAAVKSDGEIVDGGGYFFPKRISDGVIYGLSNEYAENDPHCCPSLFFEIALHWSKDGLKAISRIAIPKPPDFE